MAVTNLGGGRFKIFHKEVAAPTAEMEHLRSQAPRTPTGLSGFLQGSLHANGFKQLRAYVANSDSEWTRQQILDMDNALASIANEIKLDDKLTKARNTVLDVDLTDAARRKRALVIIADLLDDIHGRHGRVVARAMTALNEAVDVVKMALAPDLTGNEQVRELRAQEVRRVIFDVPKGDRAALVLDLGNRAALEGLLACESCPLGRLVEDEILTQAKRGALAKMGVDFLLDQIEDRRDILRNVAARCDMLEQGIREFLSAYGVRPVAPVTWIVATASAIEESGRFLTIPGGGGVHYRAPEPPPVEDEGGEGEGGEGTEG